MRSSTSPPPIRHQRHERQLFGISHLFEREGLKVGIGFDRIDEVGDLTDTCADRAHERLLSQADRFAKPLALAKLPGLIEKSVRGVGLAHPWSAERPAGPGREIHAQPETTRFTQGVRQKLEPAVRQVRDEPCFLAAHAINRRELDTTEAGRIERLELASDGRGIKRAA